MRKFTIKPFSYMCTFIACFVMVLTSGCASGGFKLTRQYAQWVNSQMIILRIVLYLLTGIVFFVTLLIDLVVNNTMDFWDGRVSSGTYEFKKDGKIYVARHEYMPETRLRRSTIHVSDSDGRQLQEVVLSETPAGSIEMFVDGKLKT